MSDPLTAVLGVVDSLDKRSDEMRQVLADLCDALGTKIRQHDEQAALMRDRLKCTEERLTGAEKRVAELEARLETFESALSNPGPDDSGAVH